MLRQNTKTNTIKNAVFGKSQVQTKNSGAGKFGQVFRVEYWQEWFRNACQSRVKYSTLKRLMPPPASTKYLAVKAVKVGPSEPSLHEANVAEALRHADVTIKQQAQMVRVVPNLYCFIELDGYDVFVMEYIDGKSLFTLHQPNFGTPRGG